MSYYVSLGDIELDKVTAVVQSSDRDISTYDSVGGGKFAVPQNKGLREWTIKCELEDHDIIKEFDKMLKKKTPVRLIVKSDDYKVSERVLLKGYNAPEEEYAGVFSTTLTVIEYAKVGVKTAAVPYVAREGNRVLPAQVTVTEKNQATWAFDYTQAVKGLYGPQEGWIDPASLFVGAETGKPVSNPAAVPVGSTLTIKNKYISVWEQADERARNEALISIDQQNAIQKGAQMVWGVMSKAFTEFDNQQKDRLKNIQGLNDTPGGNSGV